MNPSSCMLAAVCLATWGLTTAGLGQTAPATQQGPIPLEFKDPDTGARMLHLSRMPNAGSGVIYFHQACITPDGQHALVRVLDTASGHTAGYMYRWDFPTQELTKLTDLVTKNQVMVPKSGNMYFSSGDDRSLYVTNITAKETRKLADMPPEWVVSGGLTVNCDETLVVGVAWLTEQQKGRATLTTPPNQGSTFSNTFQRHDTNILFSVDIKSGKIKEIHRINTWLGHTQFSPTDPNLLMFCHEGPWQSVDRIWTLRVNDGSEPALVHKRTEDNEIAGHEFWSNDGKMVWFDHNYRNTPGKHFLTGKNLETGKLTQYKITGDFASIHYIPSPDGKFFLGDGGTRPNPADQAMYILTPSGDTLKPAKLCNMAKNNYRAAEPNPHVTLDQHWVIFTATLHGTPQAYAVEMPREYWR